MTTINFTENENSVLSFDFLTQIKLFSKLTILLLNNYKTYIYFRLNNYKKRQTFFHFF